MLIIIGLIVGGMLLTGVNTSVNIDSELDWLLAEALLARKEWA